MNSEQHLLEDISVEELNKTRRRALLPIWIKIFTWIFMIMGTLAVPLFILGISGFKYEMALYGLETKSPASFQGIFLLVLFLYKGIVAYSLWFEWNRAIALGVIDAILGIVVCAISMYLFSTFRVEVVILLPYLVKLLKIKDGWQKFGAVSK